MQQKSFIDLAYENKKKKIRAELFLEKMEKVLPWSKLLKPLRKRYPKGARGRPPIDLEKMLRIYFMQQWFSLGDEKMEEAWYDHISKKRFAGVQEEVPDRTTIWSFADRIGEAGAAAISAVLGHSFASLARRAFILRFISKFWFKEHGGQSA